MTYEVIARVCGHAVRATSSNLDYCTACRNSRRIREERDRAEMEYSRDYMLHDLLPEEHPRRESTYRDQTEYRRRSSRYEPGRYADRSGRGFYNTNDPVRDRGYGYEDDVVDVDNMTPQDIRDHILRMHCPIRPVYWHNGELRCR
ncbi:hypothetical protein KC331_g10814 [Hortaea werneckii]|nr:hypothetical protein KC331_g10814 [Hortaea werneckii]KAI7708769.1 hypothetical protein KC353_g10820 [Hortaea werneckii]